MSICFAKLLLILLVVTNPFIVLCDSQTNLGRTTPLNFQFFPNQQSIPLTGSAATSAFFSPSQSPVRHASSPNQQGFTPFINDPTSESSSSAYQHVVRTSSHPLPFGPQQHGLRHTLPRQQQTPFTMEDFLSGRFRPDTWNGTWISDVEFIYRNGDNQIALFNVVEGVSSLLVTSNTLLKDLNVLRFWLSPDRRFLLLATNAEKIYRHSLLAIYKVLEISTGRIIPLQPGPQHLDVLSQNNPFFPPPPPSPSPAAGRDGASALHFATSSAPPSGPQQGFDRAESSQVFDDERPPIDSAANNNRLFELPLQYAMWSNRGSSIAYVFSNNIFYRENPDAIDLILTHTGIPGVIFNGVADWVYEEEVLTDTKALYFSPDDQRLSWIQFNDSEVDVQPLNIYGRPGRPEFQYPLSTPLRYPKPGRVNPTVSIFVVNVHEASVISSTSGDIFAASLARVMQPPLYFESGIASPSDKIIYAVTWATHNELSLTWENRHQNYSVVSICRFADVGGSDGDCVDNLVMTEPRGWLQLTEPPVFRASGRQFAMILSSNGFKHVNIIDRDTNQRVPITRGPMTVISIYHWDDYKDHVIYFLATPASRPAERHLYIVSDFDSQYPGRTRCISCDVTNMHPNGVQVKTSRSLKLFPSSPYIKEDHVRASRAIDGIGPCGYNSFKFSKNHTFYTMSCGGPNIPQEFLFHTSSPNRKVATLVTNERLARDLMLKKLPKVSHLDVTMDNGFVAKVRLYFPPDFSVESVRSSHHGGQGGGYGRKKYPLLLYVYGGPNSQEVNDKFRLDWGTYLTTSEDVIYARIDGRGSGYRGDDLLFQLYYRLGTVEVEDQIEVTRKLVTHFSSFIDPERVAIWGWSYGGFVTLSALSSPYNTFDPPVQPPLTPSVGFSSNSSVYQQQPPLFKCGVAVAPVTNWIYYDTIHTERYMGLPLPNDNERGYVESDLSSKVEGLRGKHLLLVHGTADDNVHYQQTMMLTRSLEEADILFSQLTYPDENHGIVSLRKHFYHSLNNFVLNQCFKRNEII